jgi:glycerophosphoryl diester phosphodiesterase
LDIQLSADGHWILFHNDFMDFHTSVDGCISQFNADFLETVAYHGFPNIKIARFDKIDVGGFETTRNNLLPTTLGSVSLFILDLSF